MKLTEAKLKELIKEAMEEEEEDWNDPEKILKMIDTSDPGYWAQAFEWLSMGLAQDWNDDAKTDLVWGVWDRINHFHGDHIAPLEAQIRRYNNRNSPHVYLSNLSKNPIPTQQEVKGLEERVEELKQDEKRLIALAADLLKLPEDWWESRWKRDMNWKDKFKEAGII